MLDSDAESAKTLTLVAIILQAIFLFVGIAIVIGVLAFAFTSSTSGIPGMGAQALVGIIFGAIFLVGILWIVLDYVFIYAPLSRGEVARTEGPALALSIIQLVFGGIITGILLIIAWVKIKDSVRNQSMRESAGQNLQ